MDQFYPQKKCIPTFPWSKASIDRWNETADHFLTFQAPILIDDDEFNKDDDEDDEFTVMEKHELEKKLAHEASLDIVGFSSI